MHVISTSTGINGARLAHHIFQASMVISVCLFVCLFVVFETVPGREHSEKVSNNFNTNFFSEESTTKL